MSTIIFKIREKFPSENSSSEVTRGSLCYSCLPSFLQHMGTNIILETGLPPVFFLDLLTSYWMQMV